MNALPHDDLQAITAETRTLWEKAPDSSILITGGTGFFGIWLLESLCAINQELGTKLRATVLSRDPERFLRKVPHLRGKAELSFVSGDVRSFDPGPGRHQLVLHGATEASASMIAEAPLEMYSTICDGTRHVLELAARGGCQRFLFLSSGAVYGEQPPGVPLVAETHVGAPDPLQPGAVYGEAKRMAENLCAMMAKAHGFEFCSARCFAFVGPHLPLDTHFAVGNFLRDVLAGKDIEIKGDGTPLRSYLYSSDLCTWLWTLLLKGRNGQAYNVGSEEGISIRDLAQVVLKAGGSQKQVHVAGTPDGRPPKRYVPSTQKIRHELGLAQKVSLENALLKTLAWQRQQT